MNDVLEVIDDLKNLDRDLYRNTLKQLLLKYEQKVLLFEEMLEQDFCNDVPLE